MLVACRLAGLSALILDYGGDGFHRAACWTAFASVADSVENRPLSRPAPVPATANAGRSTCSCAEWISVSRALWLFCLFLRDLFCEPLYQLRFQHALARRLWRLSASDPPPHRLDRLGEGRGPADRNHRAERMERRSVVDRRLSHQADLASTNRSSADHAAARASLSLSKVCRE